MNFDRFRPMREYAMMLHFAFGANMSRAIMERYAPDALPLGQAKLANHRFHITRDGYASIEPVLGQCVHGVLWRISPRDRVRLDIWENIGAGLYSARVKTVRRAGHVVPALVYIARSSGGGWPKPGYMELVLAAAEEWDLPSCYLATLKTWFRSESIGTGRRKIRMLDFACRSGGVH
jgi:hypothetical protein